VPRKKTSGKEGEFSALLARIAELEERVGKLEAERDAALSAAASALVPAPMPQPSLVIGEASPAAVEEISEEVLSVISAAVAAFLGLRVRVRQVRLRRSEAWAQQGRVSIMASHRWAIQR
jgi:methylmalonyl-CoA carboxyltransferase 12S subunit